MSDIVAESETEFCVSDIVAFDMFNSHNSIDATRVLFLLYLFHRVLRHQLQSNTDFIFTTAPDTVEETSRRWCLSGT